jgi:transcription initiation factor TFIIB
MQGQAFALKVDPDAPQKEAAFRQDLNVRLVCPDCADDSQLVEEFSSGDLVCGNCGELMRRFNLPASERASED